MACGHIPRVSAHLHMAIPLCVFLRFLSLRRTPVSELKAHPDNPGSPHLKTHLQSRSRLDTSTRIWAATVHPTTLALAFFLIAHLLRAHSPLGPMGKAQHDPHEADGQTEAQHSRLTPMSRSWEVGTRPVPLDAGVSPTQSFKGPSPAGDQDPRAWIRRSLWLCSFPRGQLMPLCSHSQVELTNNKWMLSCGRR